MKKFIILFVFSLITSACNKDSGSSSDTSFRIKADTLTAFASPATSFYTNRGDGNYAVIYNGTIDGTNYIGIACSNSPNYPENTIPETNNLKIYYQGNSISNVSLTGGTSPDFNVIHNGTDQTGAGTYNFIFTPNTVGTYTTYTIEITGSGYLTTTAPNHITALYIGSN